MTILANVFPMNIDAEIGRAFGVGYALLVLPTRAEVVPR